MKLLKPSWVTLDGRPIFSVDIHPDGTKFATGGQGEDCGLVVIWNLLPVKTVDDENDSDVPRMLCQMDNHSGCVNSVRWSSHGTFLATGSDDKCVMIWQSGKTPFGASTAFGSGSAVANGEYWRCMFVLRGHSEDVLDLAWSPDDQFLASGSVDNTVIIWNANNFPESLQVLTGHEGLVKGVAWDPIGKFFASQSDDKSLTIWRTSDWQPEKKITDPFVECCGTTHVLRLSWSTDGQYLVSAHAMNKGGPVAKIINRNGWSSKMDFVGHRKAVTCVRFNNRLFTKTSSGPSATIKQYSCCAIGSKDRSLSVWLTTLKRPLVVIHELFKSSIMDLSWSAGGFGLMACSLDGTVAYFEFDSKELGVAMSDEDKFIYHKQAHGANIKSGHSTFASTFIENPDLLKARKSPLSKSTPAHKEGSASKPHKPARRLSALMPVKSASLGGDHFGVKQLSFSTATSDERDAALDVLKKQKETITPNGKRRITPLSLSLGTSCEPMEQQQGLSSKENNVARFTMPERAPATAVNSSVGNKESPLSKSGFSTTSSALTVKRKLDSGGSGERKRGRKEKDKSEKNDTSKKQDDERRSICESDSRGAKSAQTLFIPHPEVERKLYLQIGSETGHLANKEAIEAENCLTNVSSPHFLRCLSNDTIIWEAALPSAATVLAGSRQLICASCSDKTIHVFSKKGSRLLPSLVMETPISFLHCNTAHVMAVTASGTLFVWDVTKQSAIVTLSTIASIVKDHTLSITQTLLSSRGHPIVCLSNNTAFSFSPSLQCWTPLANSVLSQYHVADFASTGNTPTSDGSGILQMIQSPCQSSLRHTSSSLRLSSAKQQSVTLSHLQSQMLAAKEVGSPDEYRHWLQTYARHLVQCGREALLREVCDDLLGPVHSSHQSVSLKWDESILNFKKRSLLQDVLSIVATNLQFQRLYVEYKDLLDQVKI